MEVEMDEEQREKEAMAAYARLLDRAQVAGAHMGATTRAFTGEFRQDGALVPTDGYGVAMVPAYHLNSAAGHGEEGFVVQLLFYADPDRYAVVEVVWEAEPSKEPAAYPIGKPHPDGTAPLRYVEEGEDVPGDCMVVWDDLDTPCPLRCRVYPEAASGVTSDRGLWLSEEEARGEFGHLFAAPGD